MIQVTLSISKDGKGFRKRIIRINGGVRVDDLMQKTPSEVSKETKRIMDEVMPYTDRFVMREANNLSPCTPVENIYAMYQTVREYGNYV